MAVTNGGVHSPPDQGVRAALEGLRAAAGSHEGSAAIRMTDAKAVLDDAWATLAEVLAERSTPEAVALLDKLRCLSDIDQSMLRTQTATQLGEVLSGLEKADCSVRGLVEMTPDLIGELGVDRAIISRIDEVGQGFRSGVLLLLWSCRESNPARVIKDTASKAITVTAPAGFDLPVS